MDRPETSIIDRWQKILSGDTHEYAAFVDQYKCLVTSIAYSCTGGEHRGSSRGMPRFVGGVVCWDGTSPQRSEEVYHKSIGLQLGDARFCIAGAWRFLAVDVSTRQSR